MSALLITECDGPFKHALDRCKYPIVMCSLAASRNLALVRTGTRLPISCFKSALRRSSGLSCGL